MADSDRSDELRRPRKRQNLYARGGSVSDMVRLLAANERKLESRPVRRLAMAGGAIAVFVVAAWWFLTG